jgi:hypothetical protein
MDAACVALVSRRPVGAAVSALRVAERGCARKGGRTAGRPPRRRRGARYVSGKDESKKSPARRQGEAAHKRRAPNMEET